MHTKKKLHRNRYEIAMIAIVGGATLLRLILLLCNWPAPNSDESIMDLMAYHITYNGEHPTFYYGQSYMASIEAFIGSALFHLFGVSALAVRLGLLPFYAIFLVCMYYLTSMLYTRGLALFTIGLLSLGSGDIFLHQLLAIGGYPEIVCFAALMFLLAVWLAHTAPTRLGERAPTSKYWRRLLLYLVLGVIIGLAMWDDQLIAPFVLATGLLILLFCWRDLLGWASLCLLAGFVIGALPLIIYNLYYALPGENSWDILLYLHHVGSDQVAAAHITEVQRLIGVLLFSIPFATGFNPCNRTIDLPLYEPTNHHTLACITAQGTWSAAFTALWLIAIVLVLQNIWSIYRLTRKGIHTQENVHVDDLGSKARRMPSPEASSLQREVARLLLLMTTAITFLMFVTSNAAALYPVSSARYLILFLLATPAILWPLWKYINIAQILVRKPKLHPGRIIGQLLCIGMLLFVGATFVVGTFETFTGIPTAQAAVINQQALTRDLLRVGATRLYTDYWTCIRIIFESREHIICADLNPPLGQSYNRYKPYRYAVDKTAHPAYLFPQDSPLIQLFMTTHKNDTHYQRYDFDGYVLYQYKT